MNKFEFLPHTADLKIRSFGKDEKETLKNAVFALNQFLEAELSDEEVETEIEVEEEKPYLWLDFLSEILTQTYIQKAIFDDIKFLEFSETKIKAKIKGKKFNSIKKDIKAITYHQAEIKKNKTYQFTFVCDI